MRSNRAPFWRAPYASAAFFAGLAFWLCIVLVVGIALERERRAVLAQALQRASTLAAVLEENTARTFESVDVALQGLGMSLVARDLPRHDASTREQMRALLKRLSPVRAIFVIGPDGFIQHDTDYPTTPDVSLADRDYFRQYLVDPQLRHALSTAVQSRSGTGWFVAATRRIPAPEGQFRGIIVAAVQLDLLPTLYKKLDLADGQAMALFHANGQLMARYPPEDRNIGRDYAAQPMFAEHLSRQRAGVYMTDGPPLGYPRVVSYRAVENQPLVVALFTRRDTVLAAWHRTAAGAAAALALFTLLTGTGVLFFIQRQEQAQRALAHRAAEAEAAALAEANAKFRAFFEQGSLLSCVLSREGVVLEANRTGLAASGCTRDQVVGRKLWECDWWKGMVECGAAVQAGVAEAANGATFRCETAFFLADGRRSLLELVLSPVRDGQGAVLSIAAVGVDITERKRQEEELRTLADQLTSANRLKADFLATLSHELRNILAPIRNALEIVDRAPPGSAPGARAREIMRRQLDHMGRLVDDLMDVARVNSGKVRLKLEHLDFREVLASAAEAAQAFMEAPHHRFTASWPDQPLPVYVDRTRMVQVLANLLSNAAKYTPPRGNIQLKARRDGDELVVEVVDDGLGIPPAARAKIFDMFEQISGHLSKAQGGLGIGLALVQQLVALHGGQVEAFSEGADQGSTFTVHLPLATPADGSGVQPGAAGAPSDDTD